MNQEKSYLLLFTKQCHSTHSCQAVKPLPQLAYGSRGSISQYYPGHWASPTSVGRQSTSAWSCGGYDNGALCGMTRPSTKQLDFIIKFCASVLHCNRLSALTLLYTADYNKCIQPWEWSCRSPVEGGACVTWNSGDLWLHSQINHSRASWVDTTVLQQSILYL